MVDSYRPFFGVQFAYERIRLTEAEDARFPSPLKIVVHPQASPAHEVEIAEGLIGRLVNTVWKVAGKVRGEVVVSTKTVNDAQWVFIFVVPGGSGIGLTA